MLDRDLLCPKKTYVQIVMVDFTLALHRLPISARLVHFGSRCGHVASSNSPSDCKRRSRQHVGMLCYCCANGVAALRRPQRLDLRAFVVVYTKANLEGMVSIVQSVASVNW
jgi:hypothetical protein